METTITANQAIPIQNAIPGQITKIIDSIVEMQFCEDVDRVLTEASKFYHHPDLDSDAVSWNPVDLENTRLVATLLPALSDPDRKEAAIKEMIKLSENMVSNSLLNVFDIALFGRNYLNQVIRFSEPASAELIQSLFFVRELANLMIHIDNLTSM